MAQLQWPIAWAQQSRVRLLAGFQQSISFWNISNLERLLLLAYMAAVIPAAIAIVAAFHTLHITICTLPIQLLTQKEAWVHAGLSVQLSIWHYHHGRGLVHTWLSVQLWLSVISMVIITIFHSTFLPTWLTIMEEDLGPHPATSKAISTLSIATSTAINIFDIQNYYLHVYIHGGRLVPSMATNS